MGWLSRRVAQGVRDGIEAVDWDAIGARVGAAVVASLKVDDVARAISASPEAGVVAKSIVDYAVERAKAELSEAVPRAAQAALGGHPLGQLFGGLFGGGGKGSGGGGWG